MRFDRDKTLRNAGRAETAELLDRVTVFRDGMEPEALDIFMAELARRGIGPDEIHAHDRALKHRVVQRTEGSVAPVAQVAQCSFCLRAATETSLDWHRLWGLLPLFKRRFYYCDRHAAERRRPDRERA